MSNILIICYDFPPNQGIGGRRWAKISRALAENDHQVHVLKADPVSGNSESPWTEDTLHPNIQITSLERKYPEVISHPGGSLWSKINYRIQRRKLRRSTKGTIYDISLGWKESMLSAARKIIKEDGIANVIITGAPFNLFYYGADLKKEFPNIKLILDYRDPWLTAVNYGIPQLDYVNFLHEKQKQQVALDHTDIVSSPYEDLNADIFRSCDQRIDKNKIKLLPHFYDRTDLERFLPASTPENAEIRIVYGGTLYMGLEPHFNSLCLALDKIKLEQAELYSKLNIELYSKDQQFKALFSHHAEVVKLEKPIGKKLFERIAGASACFLFLAHHNRHYKTTKFYELMPFGKPLIFMGDEGLVSEFIEDEKLGVVMHDPENEFITCLEDIMNGKLANTASFDHSEYSLESITKTVEGWLQ